MLLNILHAIVLLSAASYQSKRASSTSTVFRYDACVAMMPGEASGNPDRVRAACGRDPRIGKGLTETQVSQRPMSFDQTQDAFYVYIGADVARLRKGPILQDCQRLMQQKVM